MTRPTVCIFARAPVPGTVKRRLAAGIGDAAALEAHLRLLGDTLDRLTGLAGIDTELWLAGDPATLTAPLPDGLAAVRRQGAGDLGQRMLEALTATLVQAPKALVVGTDCPDIDAGYVAEAFARLDADDVVLGPAEDGGYGLIGARRQAAVALPALFREVAWGTSSVLETTLQRARAAGLQVAQLAEIWDVDTAADWQRFLSSR